MALTGRCPACGLTVRVTLNAHGRYAVAIHDDRVRLVCPGSGRPIVIDVVESL